MSWYNAYWQGLVATITTAWPDIQPAQLFIDTTLERLDWINLLNANRIGPEWAIVRLTIDDEDGFNSDWPAYRVTAMVHYVALSSIATTGAVVNGAAPTMTEYLAAKMTALRQSAYRSPLIGTVLSAAPLSLSADDPVNVVLLDAKIPIQSGGITLTSIVVDMG